MQNCASGREVFLQYKPGNEPKGLNCERISSWLLRLNNSDSIGLFAGQKVLKEFQVSGESCSDHREVKIYVYLCCQEEELEAFEIPVASVVVAACDRFRAFSENLVSRVEFGDCATQRNDSVLPHRFGAKTYNLLKETLNCRLLGDYFFSGD